MAIARRARLDDRVPAWKGPRRNPGWRNHALAATGRCASSPYSGGEAGFTAGHPGDESGRNRTERWAACPTGRSREANWAQAQPATFV